MKRKTLVLICRGFNMGVDQSKRALLETLKKDLCDEQGVNNYTEDESVTVIYGDVKPDM